MLTDIQKTCSLIFLYLLVMLGASYYMQYIMLLEPCSLCVLQRWLVITISCTTFILCFFNKPNLAFTVVFAWTFLAFISAFMLNIHHISIQISAANIDFSSEPVACLPPLNWLLEKYSFDKVIVMLLNNSESCGEVKERFFGLSVPQLLLVFYLPLMALYAYVFSLIKRFKGSDASE